MIRHRLLLKSFAIFFVLEMLFSIFTPAISWALTAGPTAPEATSFEPVDTTDIVDLKTGDFVYNMPLFELPGPAGSYPISLSYHAGILPDQESSWTGLGFTLNPGSVFRLVNGYPDDHNDVLGTERTYWRGGSRESYTVGISIGIANCASVSAGMTFSQDTYRGRGVGEYVGVGVGYQLTKNVGVGADVTLYGNPYGGGGVSAGIGLGIGITNYSAINLGIGYDTQSGIGANAGVGITAHSNSENYASDFGSGISLLGASISSSSGGSKGALSVGGGVAGVYNGRQNHVSHNGDHFQVDIPVWYGLSVRLGRDYQRYWIDETATAHTFGSLYQADIDANTRTAFDTYDAPDLHLNAVDHSNAEKVLGGSIPDVDIYTVTAQGVSGNIIPYHFRQHLYGQEKQSSESNEYLIKNYPLSTGVNQKTTEFRFINDFSNRFQYTPDALSIGNSSVTFDFDDDIITGIGGSDGYNKGKNHLAGSKHIEWYTNHEIQEGIPFSEGFIDCVAEGFQRSDDLQIGGFSITNASGVTYHYGLPAYSYDEYTLTLNSTTKQDTDGLRWNEVKKPTKYAYTWFLTAVTGPDFVDKNNNHIADHGDWGYWVNFEYSKWVSDYKWRNPGEDFNRDIDGEFETYSSGRKEIYYLEKMITETHVALFEKSPRIDGREVADLTGGGFAGNSYVVTPGKQECVDQCNASCIENGNCDVVNCNDVCSPLPDHVIAYNNFPRPCLKLDRIKIVDYGSFVGGHVDENYVLRQVDFDYDYSLATGTPNSYEESSYPVKQGKLTLKKLSFAGKKGVSLIPPITFDYKNKDYQKDFKDVWGFFKSDFSSTFRDHTNDVMGRLPSDESALDVDAWSLNQINTALGASIKINFESDRYDEVVLENQQVLRVKDVSDEGSGLTRLTFWESDLNLSLFDYFAIGQKVNLDLIGAYSKENDNTRPTCSCGYAESDVEFDYMPVTTSGTVQVVSVDNASILVDNNFNKNDNFYDRLWKKEKRYTYVKEDHNASGDGCYELKSCTFYWQGENAKPSFVMAGVVSYPKVEDLSLNKPGGGLRVKSIELTNGKGDGRVTSYQYEHGVTSYEPYQILPPLISPADIETIPDIKTYVKKIILKRYHNQIAISRLLPGPNVLYKNVRVKETNISADHTQHELPNYSQYEFTTYDKDWVNLTQHEYHVENISGSKDYTPFDKVIHNEALLKDYSAWVGNLKSVILYDSKGTDTNTDDEPVSTTINNYLEDNPATFDDDLEARFFNQGLIEQSFSRSRIAYYGIAEKRPYLTDGTPVIDIPTLTASNLNTYYFGDYENDLLVTLSKVQTFPSVPLGQTNINHKTKITTNTENVAFDFFSGEVTKVISSDSYKNRYMSEKIPAYRKYGAMGLKTFNIQNKNMLTQIAQESAYIVDSQNQPTGVLSSFVQTWSDKIPVLNLSVPQTNIWRMMSSYQWSGGLPLQNDGSYPYEDYYAIPFTHWNSTNERIYGWQKIGEISLYDVYSKGLEAKDMNDQYSATRTNRDQTKVIASISNSRYHEMAYSGAEYYLGNTDPDGGVLRGDGNPSKAHIHTGHSSLLVGVNKRGFNYTLDVKETNRYGKYKASVWVYAPGETETQSELDKIELYYTINGQEKASVHPLLNKNKSKNWYQLNIDVIPDGVNNVYVGVRNSSQRAVYFDDFRVYPFGSILTSYVYDAFSGEITYILDANNFYTKFEYDEMGRLVRTSKELLNFDFGDGRESYRSDAVVGEMKYNYNKSN